MSFVFETPVALPAERRYSLRLRCNCCLGETYPDAPPVGVNPLQDDTALRRLLRGLRFSCEACESESATLVNIFLVRE